MTVDPKNTLANFVEFIREQGVIGLAIGFILGGAVTKLVAALVSDIINPILGLALGKVGNLQDATFNIGSAVIAWGSFAGTVIDFLVIALVVYVGVKILGLNKLDKKK